MDPDKYALITNWPTPRNVKDILSLRAWNQFNREHWEKHNAYMEPIYRLCKKHEKFRWEKAQEEAFAQWKKEYPAMLKPFIWDDEKDPSERTPLIVETDASSTAWAASVMQINAKGEKNVLGYASGLWDGPQQSMSTTRRELLVAILALEKYAYYAS